MLRAAIALVAVVESAAGMRSPFLWAWSRTYRQWWAS